ncbi:MULTISPECIES: flagellar hook-basal body complex protein [Pseudoalteromonas]|jgi:flagellar hook protein FlgE|uniref:flagellar hook protein FlgE n=1 Tax=Pseudoalteromonas TaxID=53246 RepID=UPI000C5C3ACC|nr:MULTISPECIES: flagellar hook-basal body complex protein [Pseudoalteromonas]MAY59721.1 flagellar biosynthesis protein FlgE [Pseudoalteromonas sp.]MDN3404477.1 flagellar hook-basal body complex protein [Pseudoalteromonas sp. APC 3218]MDN3408380.1 flagellar hook-basal body complex protein [Pseudoalteromonas sp. APC 3894]MDN3416020.1 flagellar hook-basal body complex protein [Pseudoalteromonas sp. APC 3227]MDN3419718.1 flagellar hook-basal body complex protein [Pseudoalteromonas sp. APC 3895]
MSMFNIGLSGLKSTQTGLEVTSNNIANSGTAGYKNNTAEFAAVYNGSQRGGVKVANVKEDFVTGGEIVRTGNALDIAIDGQGFFAISENGRTAYTQAGQFQLDNDLNIVNANGGKLQGFGVSQVDGGDPTIVPGVLTDLKIEASNIEAQASTNINFNGNLSSSSDVIAYPTAPAVFDPKDGSQYNFSQSTEVFDSLGNSHVMTQYFNHTGSNEWQAMFFLDGKPLTQGQLSALGATTGSQAIDDGAGGSINAGTISLNFDTDGKMVPFSGDLTAVDLEVPITSTPGNAEITSGAAALNIALKFDGTTQFGSSFSVNENDANGYTSGAFSGVKVEDDGRVFATFTNGESKLQGQVVLASFANVDGLEQGSNTVWYQTEESGSALYGEPESGSLGKLLSGSFMGSNVDISEQLVGLMSFQQNYQANAKTISSADEMMQILFSNT